MPHDIKQIFAQFNTPGKFIDADSYGSGHINDTFLVNCDRDDSGGKYILQRINQDIFTNPVQVMENIVRVTEHIKTKLKLSNQKDISRKVLTLIPTHDQQCYHKDQGGNYWRVYLFIANAITCDVAQSQDQIYQAARSFGQFQNMLVDLPQPMLHETIPDFHNGSKHFEAFKLALEADTCNRAKDAKPQIEFLLKHASIFDVLPDLVKHRKLPLRTTHNDTKINNVMFDSKTGKALCVIDLDTVMPGLVLDDFGDIVRTATSLAEEDEPDLSKVSLELSRFEAIVRGYLSAAGSFLNKTERQNLVFGAKRIIFEQFTRFLTDYLQADTYYKTHRQRQNLDRCRTQLKLVKLIIKYQDKMNAIVEKYSNQFSLK